MHYNIYILIHCEFNSRAMRFFFSLSWREWKSCFRNNSEGLLIFSGRLGLCNSMSRSFSSAETSEVFRLMLALHEKTQLGHSFKWDHYSLPWNQIRPWRARYTLARQGLTVSVLPEEVFIQHQRKNHQMQNDNNEKEWIEIKMAIKSVFKSN